MDLGFFQMLLYVLGAMLLVTLIILVIKLIYTITRVNSILDNLEVKIKAIDKAFNAVDRVVDSLSLVSDRIVDGITLGISKIFSNKKGKRNINKKKEEE